jgi:hypothetical protein
MRDRFSNGLYCVDCLRWASSKEALRLRGWRYYPANVTRCTGDLSARLQPQTLTCG